MRKPKKKTVIISSVIAAVLILAVVGVILLNSRYNLLSFILVGKENLPLEHYAGALEGANSDTPYATENTKPENMGFVTKLELNGTAVDSFSRTEKIDFSGDYTALEGLITFRGSNLRNASSYGTAKIIKEQLNADFWSYKTGKLPKGYTDGYWSGNGWTGQPVLVRWDEATRQIMNLYPEKKAKADLVEAIYPSMDGHIYFLDIEDGTPTRDAINVGLSFKGSCSLHPGGVPLLVLGAGDSQTNADGSVTGAGAYIYSLIDGTKLYEFGINDPFSPRIFHAYDSSALFDIKNDLLIYPGENGVLYQMKLNTEYDPEAGTLSVAPSEMLKWTYSTKRTGEKDFWWGMESSAVIWEGYLFITDNAGDVFCLDLNTMQVVWVQDTMDDTNASPVFEIDENGNKFLYVAPSLHWQANPTTKMGKVSLFKLNAMTGEIIWKQPYECHTVQSISGGIQATPVVGQGEISDLVICPIARTPRLFAGRLVAVNKTTGETVWTLNMDHYAWSSPIAVYADNGRAYLIQCDSDGNMMLIEGTTGKVLHKLNFGTNIEATPGVFENKIVVGTRDERIVGVTIE